MQRRSLIYSTSLTLGDRFAGWSRITAAAHADARRSSPDDGQWKDLEAANKQSFVLPITHLTRQCYLAIALVRRKAGVSLAMAYPAVNLAEQPKTSNKTTSINAAEKSRP